MQKFMLIFLPILAITYSTISHAGLLVEPVLGFNIAKDVSTNEKDYSSGQGVGYGGRLGYQAGPFQIGGDYLNSSLDMSSSDFDNNLKVQEYGAFVGFEFPILVRTYATYIFSTSGDTKINSENSNLNGGDGFKIGVGFTLLPLLDLNLDYRKLSFDDNFDFETFMFSVSMPFNLF